MQIHRNEIADAGFTRRGRRKGVHLLSVDVVPSTSEISNLIEELETLKREGRSKTGYHIHLFDPDETGKERTQVSLFHEKTYSPEEFSETIVFG